MANTERTRGRLEAALNDLGGKTIKSEDGNTLFDPMVRERPEMRANSEHVVACWNAIESIGGDPKTVGKFKPLLLRVKEFLLVGEWDSPVHLEGDLTRDIDTLLAKIGSE